MSNDINEKPKEELDEFQKIYESVFGPAESNQIKTQLSVNTDKGDFEKSSVKADPAIKMPADADNPHIFYQKGKDKVNEEVKKYDSKNQHDSVIHEKQASDGELEFDSRFHLRKPDETRRFNYGSDTEDSDKEYNYRENEAQDTDELSSSHIPSDDFFSVYSESTDEPEVKEKKFGFLNKIRFFKKKKTKDDFESKRDFAPEKDVNAAEEDINTPEDSRQYNTKAAAYEYDDDEADSFTFSQFLASRITALIFKLRGAAPADKVNATMNEADEFLGQEVSTMFASKYYGSYIYSLRIRFRIALIMFVIMAYLSLGLPSPGMLKALPVAVSSVMALQFFIMLLALDVVTNGITNLLNGKPGADTLAVLSCIITALDAVFVLKVKGVTAHMPLCAASSLSLLGVLFASLLSARGIRKALRVPAIGKNIYSVTSEEDVIGRDITILKSKKPITGFIRRIEEEPLDEMVFRKASPFVAAAALIFAFIAAIIRRDLKDFIYIFSVILSPAVPFTALLSFSLPFFVGSMRIFSSGTAIAGWSGLVDIGRSKNLIVTDRDLFSPECIEIKNVRIFADYPADKVITYAGSMILKSECGLCECFEQLMYENSCRQHDVDNFEAMPGGGLKGMIEGHNIICGGPDLMRLMDIKVPFKLVSGTTVLLAIDGILYGIFNIKYSADPKVRKALVSLMRSNRHPVFAIRDFNITPEMIRDCFDVATDGYDFPPYVQRYPLSEAQPSVDSKIAAVICREGLSPLTAVADTGRSIYVITRINTLITVFVSFIGIMLMFFRLTFAGAAGVNFVLIFMLISMLPVLVLGFLANSLN